jgi:hypothetical protein
MLAMMTDFANTLMVLAGRHFVPVNPSRARAEEHTKDGKRS